MVLRGYLAGSAYVISVKGHSLAVMVDDHLVVSYDRGGRLYSFHLDSHTYRRGLSGAVIEKWHEGSARFRRVVPVRDRDTIIDQGAGVIARLLASLDGVRWSWDEPAGVRDLSDLREFAGRAARFDAASARQDEHAFERVYRPVGILPPDQYLSVVVQATEGCSFNTCTFCDLYHDGYRVKTPGEFERHVDEVLEYLGESRSLRSRGVFLGAANALAVPMARLRPMFEILSRRLGPGAPGVFAFVDGFTGARKTAADYAELRALGLRRVYLGLESGHDPLLEFVRKPGTARDAIDTARAIKAAGLSLGVIVMIGLGGSRFAGGHASDTVVALNEMNLDERDLLYFSDLVEIPGTSYPIHALEQDIGALTASERRAQELAIRSAVRFAGPPPRMAEYDVREFVY